MPAKWLEAVYADCCNNMPTVAIIAYMRYYHHSTDNSNYNMSTATCDLDDLHSLQCKLAGCGSQLGVFVRHRQSLARIQAYLNSSDITCLLCSYKAS